MKKNNLMRKVRLTSKFMTPKTGEQITAIHVLSNISGSKGNQIVKRGQSIKHNLRNIYLQKSCRKYGRKTSSKPFSVFEKRFI